MTIDKKINFIDLNAQQKMIRLNIDRAISKVLESGQYIMGPEVHNFEQDLSTYTGVSHVISCSSGTDALMMALMAAGVERGDAIFVPAFTFVAAAEVAVILGATPFFVDVDPVTYNMDVNSFKQAILDAQKQGLHPSTVIPVDLYGLMADYNSIQVVADEAGILVIEDFAQSFGATLDGKFAGNFGKMAATSFFPAKPLGCYGDGGAVFTNDPELADRLRQIRTHGQGSGKYNYQRIGLTGRLDTIQAAILLEKLKMFSFEKEERQKIANLYIECLRGRVACPEVPQNMTSVWGQFTIKVENRPAFIEEMSRRNIPTAVHYPKALHHQPAYKEFPVVSSGVETSESLSEQVVSLPMHPYLERDVQDWIIESVIETTKKNTSSIR